LHYDGWTQRVFVPDAPKLQLTNSLTIEAFVKTEPMLPGTGAGAQILERATSGAGMWAYSLALLQPGNILAFGVDNSALQALVITHAIPFDQWVHVAGTLDDATGQMKLYVNGSLVESTTTSIRPMSALDPSSSPGLGIGCDNTGQYGQYLNGWLDEVRLSDAALDPSQFLSSKPVITSQPQSQIGYWGKSVTFTVTAVGTESLSYQWQKDTVTIAGATQSSLVLTNLQITNAGAYSVVITGAYGSVTSNPAILTMNPAGGSLALYAGVTIQGVVGLTYGIQYNTDLSDTNGWRGRVNVTLSTPTELWFDLQPANQAKRFYRVVPGPISIP